MTLPEIKIVANIAKQVRHECESEKGLRFPPDLMGMCAIASTKLFNRLKELNIQSSIAYCDKPCHCFILYDRYIVDITATQFGIKKRVCFAKIGKYPCHKIDSSFKTPKELRMLQDKNGWPEFQRVNID